MIPHIYERPNLRIPLAGLHVYGGIGMNIKIKTDCEYLSFSMATMWGISEVTQVVKEELQRCSTMGPVNDIVVLIAVCSADIEAHCQCSNGKGPPGYRDSVHSHAM